MGTREDRDEFNNSGARELLHRLMEQQRDEAFIKLAPGGWIGSEIPSRPEPGSGPYLHYRRGHGTLLYHNETSDDTRTEQFREWV